MPDLVYGGSPDLIHVDNGNRANMGALLASELDQLMRTRYSGDRTLDQLVEQNLCPGCYMIVALNMLLILADRNNQTRTELARTMIGAFTALLENPEAGLTEDIEVIVDPC